MIYNGIFTVISVTGESRTFKVNTKESTENNKEVRFLGLLTGPDNTKDYTYFAIVNGDKVFTFKKYRGENSQYEKLSSLFEDLHKEDSRFIKRGFKVEESRTCLKCNRVLTTPESIASGIGPVCAEKD